MHIKRYYNDIESYFATGEVVVILGPRRVGKTTLVNDYLNSYKGTALRLTGDDITIHDVLSSQDLKRITDFVKGYDLVFIDEAQRIPNIGIGLKLIVDHMPGIKIIVTGSSSFDLLGQTGEPLTGRKRTLQMYPIWLGELHKSPNLDQISRSLQNYMLYGMYPSVLLAQSHEMKMIKLREIVSSYLLKDILEFKDVKSAGVLLDMLKLVAYSVGSETSLNEIGGKLNLDVKTVARYLDLFQKTFILYNVRGLSRAEKTEINSKSKFYFYDVGIRNSIISAFEPLKTRSDIGGLWENFVFMERMKKRTYQNILADAYFWRTWEGQEIDLVEEYSGALHGIEIKYGKEATAKPPSKWLQNYKNADYKVVNGSNFAEFVI